MCACGDTKVEVSDVFSIADVPDLIELKAITENLTSKRRYRLSNGHVYVIGERTRLVYAYEGDVEELLNLTLRNKRILQR